MRINLSESKEYYKIIVTRLSMDVSHLSIQMNLGVGSYC